MVADAMTAKIDASTVTKEDLRAKPTDLKLEAIADNVVITPRPIIPVAPDPPKPPDPPITPPPDGKTAVGEFYSDIADILCSLGEGLASAQHQLDKGALATQKMILEDEELSSYGLSATWYVMPEAEFNIRMELTMSYEEKEEGTKKGTVPALKLRAAVSDAKYNSLYNVNSKQETSLKIKFVPVPMPEIVKIPKVIGLTAGVAREILSRDAIRASFVDDEGNAWTTGKGKVASQSIPAGEVVLATKVLVVTVRE